MSYPHRPRRLAHSNGLPPAYLERMAKWLTQEPLEIPNAELAGVPVMTRMDYMADHLRREELRVIWNNKIEKGFEPKELKLLEKVKVPKGGIMLDFLLQNQSAAMDAIMPELDKRRVFPMIRHDLEVIARGKAHYEGRHQWLALEKERIAPTTLRGSLPIARKRLHKILQHNLNSSMTEAIETPEPSVAMDFIAHVKPASKPLLPLLEHEAEQAQREILAQQNRIINVSISKSGLEALETLEKILSRTRLR